MLLRLKVKRQEEQRISKTKELMEMFNVPGSNSYNYQPIGASGLGQNNPPVDPKIAKTRELWRMFHIDR